MEKMPLINLPANFKDMDMDVFWYNALQPKDMGGAKVFKHLGSFVLDVLVFPHSNASFQRVFSKVNLIKTKSLNRLITRHSQWTHTRVSMCENGRRMLRVHTNKNKAELNDCNQSLHKKSTLSFSCIPTFNCCTCYLSDGQ